MTTESGPKPARRRRILTIRCVGCNSEVAHVDVITDNAGIGKKYLAFRSNRQVLKDGRWQTQRARSWFEEPLEVDPATDTGRTLAHCQRHSHWVAHADVLEATDRRIKVLRLVPADHPEQ